MGINRIKKMLPFLQRLKKKKDFEKVFKEGKGFKEDFLILKIAKNNLDQNRFGFVVSKRTSKKATLRNKIKRRLRELVRAKLLKIRTLPLARTLSTPHFKKGRYLPTTRLGRDVVLVALPGLETKDFWEMEGAINKLFVKAGLFKSSKTKK